MAEYIWSSHIQPHTFTTATSTIVRDVPKRDLKPFVPSSVDTTTLTATTAPGTTFSSRKDLLEHYKSDYHRYNLQQKLHHKDMISISAFEQKLERQEEMHELSASGSEEEQEEEGEEEEKKETGTTLTTTHRRPKMVTLQRAGSSNDLCSMWSCVTLNTGIHSNATLSPESILSIFAQKPLHWIILLYTSGHFSAGYFIDGKKIVSKTIHRYTTRRKQGGAQSQFDSGGNGPAQSAGSQIRRHNETMLHKEVWSLLRNDWKDHVLHAHSIFISCTKRNGNIFYGTKTQGTKGVPALDKKDVRLTRIPFQTKRPTLRETERVCEILGQLYPVQESEAKETTQETKPAEPPSAKKKKKKKKKKKNIPLRTMYQARPSLPPLPL